MKKWNINYARRLIALFLVIILFSGTIGGFILNLKKTSNSLLSNLYTSNSHVFDLNCIWGGPDYEYPSSVAVDSLGNIYLVGYTYSYGEGLEDILLVKFNHTGGLEWFTTWGGNDYDYGFGIAVDSFNDIYITGLTESFGAGKSDIITVKFNSFGDQLWNVTWGGTEYDRGDDIKIDSDNNICVVGRTYSFGANLDDAVILKYNIFGSLIWEVMWDRGSNDEGNGIAIDSQNNIYITGGSTNTTKDTFIAKYDSSGIHQWNKIWGGDNSDSAYKIVVDSFNNLYVGGKTYSFGNDGDILLLKYDSLGVLQSNITWGTDENDMFHGISVDSSDNLYLLYKIGRSTLPNNFLIKFNQSGSLVSNKSIDSIDFNYVAGMSIDSLDNLYIFGYNYITEQTDIGLIRFGVDTDEDGLSDWQEINIYFTDPNNPDTDEDFLNDGDEFNIYNTDPLINDTDSDGLLDGQEVYIYFTNPLNPDTDGDTLSDGDEVNIYHTDPTLIDSDGDGFRDDLEVAFGFDPNDPESNPILLIIIISSIAIVTISSLIFVLYRRNRRFKVLREKEIYEQIPNLKILIRNYVYHQLRAIHDDINIGNINLEDLDEKIREHLYLNIDNFLQFLKLEDIILTKNQIQLLQIESFEESEPIRRDLEQIITQRLENKQLERVKRDLEMQLQEELQNTNDPAYQEQIKNKYHRKFDTLRSVDEKIDTLLDQYAKWDKSDELKKV